MADRAAPRPPEARLVVVDDGSDDATGDKLDAWAASFGAAGLFAQTGLFVLTKG